MRALSHKTFDHGQDTESWSADADAFRAYCTTTYPAAKVEVMATAYPADNGIMLIVSGIDEATKADLDGWDPKTKAKASKRKGPKKEPEDE